MDKIIRRKAKEASIVPAFVTGFEGHGLCYFVEHGSDSIGGQCGDCNCVLWINSRKNSILNEALPINIPPSGEQYREYNKNKTQRFLKSLPCCPECGSKNYDRFVNNVNFPRFKDGVLFSATKETKPIYVDANSVDIWWLESK